jgi:hypothetical protein
MDTSEGGEFRGLGLSTTSNVPRYASSSWGGGTEQGENAVTSLASQSYLSSSDGVQDGSDISAHNMLRAMAIVQRIAQENYQQLQNTTEGSQASDESTFNGLGLTTRTTSSMPQHASWWVATEQQRKDDVTSQTSLPTPSGVGLQESEIAAKKLRAMAIVRRFAQEDSQQQQLQNSTVGGIHSRVGNGNGSNDNHENTHLPLQNNNNNNKYYNNSTHNPTTTPDEYRKRRMVFTEKFEHRKQEALLRNLEYVARQQIEQSKERLAQLDATRMYEQQVTSHHEAVMKSRSKSSNHDHTHHAGIGTQKRHREEQKRIQSLPKALSSNNNENSVAIYVAGISTTTNPSNNNNGTTKLTTTTTTTSTEEMMHSLFRCYGKLRKIHFYVDKQTGKRKGDALVIYDLEDAANDDDPPPPSMQAKRNSLIDSVCSQVRGTDHHSACWWVCT